MRQILLKTTIFLILLIQLAHSKSLQLEKAGATELPEKALFKEIIKRSSQDEPMSNPYLKSTGFSLIKHDLIDKYTDAQSHLSECMPGSIFYNGTCIYFSSKRQKLSWLHAERFCRRLPLDTTFLTIKNDHEFEMLKKQIIKIAQKENPIDQLVFYIGFRFFENEWKWVNNQSLKNTNLTLGKYWWDWTGSHGDCGSLALLKTNELVMRSAPCLSTHGRFLCQYTLNPCYQNDVCGKYGRCVNLYHKFYCDCSPTIFYEGKYCERWNLALIQTIIGMALIFFLAIVIWVNTSCFTALWNKHCGKKIRSHDNYLIQSRLRDQQDLEDELENSVDQNDAQVKFSDPFDSKDGGTSTQRNRFYTSISVKVSQMKKAIYIRISNNTKQAWSAYLLLFILTSFFTAVQVTVIHGFARVERLDLAKNYTAITTMCNLLEENFLLEELIILVPALLFFVVLWFYHRQRRFNKYIMVKFRGYFNTPYYARLQDEQKKIRKDQLKLKIEKLKRRGQCGKCRYWMYRGFRNSFCRVICCIFCCSCFVPPGTNNRCFICYCCYQGWRQTDLHKVFKAVRSFFYYFCLCFVWKRLWAVTKTHHKNAKSVKEQQRKKETQKEKEAEEKYTRNSKD